jgi:outer membrane receptor for ferrienterochelin and colicin
VNRFKQLAMVIVLFQLILIPITEALSQETEIGSISGTVIERLTHKPIVGANVIVIDHNRGTATDLDGEFSIDNLKAGYYHLRASALGYETETLIEVRVTANNSKSIEFLMTPTVLEAEAVTFKVNYFRNASPDLPTSARSLRYEEIRRAPGAVEDVQRMLQALPGVAGESDQNNEIVVRGGSPYENMIIMDGIEVENLNHFGYPAGTGGPVSALNVEFLKEVTFASGGFSARYGDRLSSVLDLDLREGSRDRRKGAFDFSMAGIGGNYEGPIKSGRGSYLVAARKSYLSLIKGSLGLTAVPYYWSGQAKIVYDISPKHLLTFNTLYANDHISIDDEEDGYSRGAEKVDNENEKIIVGGRLRSIWGKGFTDIVVSTAYTDYKADVWEVNESATGERVEDYYVKQYHTETISQVSLTYNGKAINNDEWSVGGGVKPISFEHALWVQSDTVYFNGNLPTDPPRVVRIEETNFFESNSSAKYYAFLQYHWKPIHSLSIVSGIRYDGYEYSGQSGIGPRLSLKYDISNRLTMNAAYGIYYQAQPLYFYNYEENGANKNLDHSRADQYILGFSFLPRESTKLSIEGYYKEYDKLLESSFAYRKENGDYDYNDNVLWATRIKDSWGFEFFAQQKMAQNWYGTFSYSYGDSQSEDHAFGKYKADYDFRHVFSAVIGYKTNFSDRPGYQKVLKTPVIGWFMKILPINGDEVQLSSRFRYITGKPYTKNVWYDWGEPSPEPIFEGHWEEEGRNSVRYPAYARFDIRLDDKYYFKGHEFTTYLEIENVVGRKNIAQYLYAEDGEIDEVYQFGFFFVGGVKFTF